MPAGCLSLILHAHLPFVRDEANADTVEEDWLFEAITGAYLPLLDVLHGMADKGLPFKIAMSISPTLGHMLGDELLRVRYEHYIGRLIAIAENEMNRSASNSCVRFQLLRLQRARQSWEIRWKRDLLSAFRTLQESGHLEIIACAATHGYLPLMLRSESVRAQVMLGAEAHRRMFGSGPRGMWLPECAWRTGVDQMLQDAGIRWSVLDSHGILLGMPCPQNAVYAPAFTPGGLAVFGRDRESACQVWNAEHGYPRNPCYRDFYRDAGWDMPEEEFQKFFPGSARRFTGLKLHRVTGSEPKQPYERTKALEQVHVDARHFVNERIRQFGDLARIMNEPPVVVCPLDAELLGHWWFEGPEWLEAVLHHVADRPSQICLVSPGEYLKQRTSCQVVEPAPSSWGQGGFNSVWLDPVNEWIYPELHAAEEKMIFSARQFSAGTLLTEMQERCLSQLARELLLAQSSDWAFLIHSGTAREYATRRIHGHLDRFRQLYAQLHAGGIETAFLENCEQCDNIFPKLNWRVYA